MSATTPSRARGRCADPVGLRHAARAGVRRAGAAVERTPAVPIKRSVTDDHIVCLEDGKKLKMLKRHLMTDHGLTPQAVPRPLGPQARLPDGGAELLGAAPGAREADRPRPQAGPAAARAEAEAPSARPPPEHGLEVRPEPAQLRGDADQECDQHTGGDDVHRDLQRRPPGRTGCTRAASAIKPAPPLLEMPMRR